MIFLIYQTQNEEFELLKSTSTSSKSFTKPSLNSLQILKFQNSNPFVQSRRAAQRQRSSMALCFSTTLVLHSTALLDDVGPPRRCASRRIWSSTVLCFLTILLL
ncbi:hypothetical protein HN51_020005 [Arachis hypogaea]